MQTVFIIILCVILYKFYSNVTNWTIALLKVCIFHLFRKPNKNYWNQLESSFELIYKNEDFEAALKLLENENLPLTIKAKFKHFAKAYNEYWYYTDYLQSVNNYHYEEVD